MCISSALKCGRYYRPKVGSLTEFKKDGFFKAINIKTLSEGLRLIPAFSDGLLC